MFKKIKEFYETFLKPIKPLPYAPYYPFDFPPTKQVVEYDVVILDPNPEETARILNEKHTLGWEVVDSYAPYRVILRRVSSVLVYPKGQNNESQAS